MMPFKVLELLQGRIGGCGLTPRKLRSPHDENSWFGSAAAPRSLMRMSADVPVQSRHSIDLEYT